MRALAAIHSLEAGGWDVHSSVRFTNAESTEGADSGIPVARGTSPSASIVKAARVLWVELACSEQSCSDRSELAGTPRVAGTGNGTDGAAVAGTGADAGAISEAGAGASAGNVAATMKESVVLLPPHNVGMATSAVGSSSAMEASGFGIRLGTVVSVETPCALRPVLIAIMAARVVDAEGCLSCSSGPRSFCWLLPLLLLPPPIP